MNKLTEKKGFSKRGASAHLTKLLILTKKHKSISLFPSLLIGLSLWYIPPVSSELNKESMHVFAVFISFVTAMLTSKYRISVLIGLALSFLAITLNISCHEGKDCVAINNINISATRKKAFTTVTEGFSKPIVWMIFCAFQIGKAVEVTGLGNRLALYLLKFFGKKSIIGVAYSFCLTEIVLAMFIPSNSARGGGVILPVLISIIELIKSQVQKEQDNELSEQTIGSTCSYLVLVAAHANLISSSMFLTGVASNPFVAKLANKHFGIDLSFSEWLKGNSIPSLISVLILPELLYCVLKPSGYNGPDIAKNVDKKINNLGKISTKELKLMIVLFGCLLFWYLGENLGLSEAFVAFIGLFILILFNIITWDDVTKNSQSWDTIFWLAGFTVLANELNNFKIASYLGNSTKRALELAALPKEIGSMFLGLIYFISMVLFSSSTGHASALVGVFFEAASKLGYPVRLVTAIIAYFTALCCCTTNYSTGPFVIYFEKGYVSKQKWFLVGTLMMVFFVLIYSTVGMLWWKIIGYY